MCANAVNFCNVLCAPTVPCHDVVLPAAIIHLVQRTARQQRQQIELQMSSSSGGGGGSSSSSSSSSGGGGGGGGGGGTRECTSPSAEATDASPEGVTLAFDSDRGSGHQQTPTPCLSELEQMRPIKSTGAHLVGCIAVPHVTEHKPKCEHGDERCCNGHFETIQSLSFKLAKSTSISTMI